MRHFFIIYHFLQLTPVTQGSGPESATNGGKLSKFNLVNRLIKQHLRQYIRTNNSTPPNTIFSALLFYEREALRLINEKQHGYYKKCKILKRIKIMKNFMLW